jgi:hypothetical protein
VLKFECIDQFVSRKGKRLHIEDNGGEGDSDIASDRTDGDWVEVLSKSTGKVYW